MRWSFIRSAWPKRSVATPAASDGAPAALASGREPPGGAALEASVYPSGLLLMTSRYRGARAWRGPAARPDFATIGPSIRAVPGARPGDHRGRVRPTSSRHDSPASLRPTAVRDSVRTSLSLSGSWVPRVVRSLVSSSSPAIAVAIRKRTTARPVLALPPLNRPTHGVVRVSIGRARASPDDANYLSLNKFCTMKAQQRGRIDTSSSKKYLVRFTRTSGVASGSRQVSDRPAGRLPWARGKDA